MAEFLPFLILILVGLLFAEFFKRLHLPYVVALILGGMIVGPFGLNIFQATPTIEFLGEIGLVFLMFMAGLEIKLSGLKEIKKGVLTISSLNAVIPFLVGIGVATYFGYGLISALLLGTIFISSSIAVIIPSLEANKLLPLRLGKTILGSTIVEDILSLLVLSILLQTIEPTTDLPLHLFYMVLLLYLIGVKTFIPKLESWLFPPDKKRPDLFEQELRFIFAVLIGTVIFFELLGVHSIIAGFLAGILLSDSIKNKLVVEKLHTISYGIFIPTFFVLIGSKTDISTLNACDGALILTVAIVGASVFAKFFSGFIGGLFSGFNKKESVIIGSSTIPQLSTTLAVAFSGLELGLLDQKMVIAITVLSIATTIAGPFLVGSLSKGYLKEREKELKKQKK